MGRVEDRHCSQHPSNKDVKRIDVLKLTGEDLEFQSCAVQLDELGCTARWSGW